MTERPRRWFDISDAGWRARNASRPLGRLMCEGLQNAFDQGARLVRVNLSDTELRIEDDAEEGFADERLVYTVYLSDKADSPTRRGRHGRGLKELLSAMDAATVETVGFTVHFDEDGRHIERNERPRGTVLTMKRASTPEELALAVETLRLVIPPEGTTVRLGNEKLRRPSRKMLLRSCQLDTVVSDGRAERIITRETDITLFKPADGTPAYLLEMGLPIQQLHTPWHVDIGQRVPLADGRDVVDENYRLLVFATLFESLVPGVLEPRDMKEDWIAECLARCDLTDKALKAYVQKAFPARTVLPSDAEADDRARQSGATILDTSAISRGHLSALGRVMETSEGFVAARQQQQQEVRGAHPNEQRAMAFLAQLSKKILGRPIRIKLMRKAADPDGIVESATFDRSRMEMRINVNGYMDLSNPLSPRTLGILFHELAHAYTDDHDLKFIQRLEEISGIGAKVLAHEGRQLAEACGIPFVWPDTEAPSGDAGFASWNTPQSPWDLRKILKRGG